MSRTSMTPLYYGNFPKLYILPVKPNIFFVKFLLNSCIYYIIIRAIFRGIRFIQKAPCLLSGPRISHNNQRKKKERSRPSILHKDFLDGLDPSIIITDL
jgi:hypothetical protein